MTHTARQATRTPWAICAVLRNESPEPTARPLLGPFSTRMTQDSLVRHGQVHKPRSDGQEHYYHE